MKKAMIAFAAIMLAAAVAGCNVAPNVPAVSPRATAGRGGVTDGEFTGFRDGARTSYGDGYNGYDYSTADTSERKINLNRALNTTNNGGQRSSVNMTDKSLLPGG